MPVVRQQDDVPSEFAKFGQMLLDGKSGKVPTIWQLKFLKDLKTFRIAYEKYTREVKTYSMTHALAIKAHPVIVCVDPDLWISISQQTLNEKHLTEEGEEPNHDMVKAYVLATEPYGDAGKKTTTNIRATFATVKFAKGPKNSTNMDRWISYVQRLRPVLKRIPMQQNQSKQYRAMYAETLRKAVQPSRLRKMVLTAVYDGLHPDTQKYDIELLDAKKDPSKTMRIIRASARALDDLIRKGILQDEWDVKEKSKEVCQNFLRGRCKLGDRCNRLHQKQPKPKTTAKTGKAACHDFMKGKCSHGDKCRYSHDQAVIKAYKEAKAKANPLKRCKNDLEGKLCKFEKQCW